MISVGAEYIIMEQVLGMESHHCWTHLAKGPQIFPLLDSVFGMECRFQCVPFSQIGSLYFEDDMHPDLHAFTELTAILIGFTCRG